MESSALAGQVVGLVAARLTGVVGGEVEDSEVGRLWVLLVERARPVPRWSVALHRLGVAPGDETARAEAKSAVIAMCVANRRFRYALETAVFEVLRSPHAVDESVRNRQPLAVGNGIRTGAYEMSAVDGLDVDTGRRPLRMALSGLLVALLLGTTGVVAYRMGTDHAAPDPGVAPDNRICQVTDPVPGRLDGTPGN